MWITESEAQRIIAAALKVAGTVEIVPDMSLTQAVWGLLAELPHRNRVVIAGEVRTRCGPCWKLREVVEEIDRQRDIRYGSGYSGFFFSEKGGNPS